MKMSREQLKALVKELMIEVLSEGLGQMSSPSRVGLASTPSMRPARQEPRRRPAFDPRLDVPVGKVPTPGLAEVVKAKSGGNPIMADILADTAMTTLQSQLSHGDSMAPLADASGAGSSLVPSTLQEQFNGDVADVFGDVARTRSDGSSHWADLAFAPAKKKST